LELKQRDGGQEERGVKFDGFYAQAPLTRTRINDARPDQSAAPALFDADLRETLDLLSTVIAKVLNG